MDHEALFISTHGNLPGLTAHGTVFDEAPNGAGIDQQLDFLAAVGAAYVFTILQQHGST